MGKIERIEVPACDRERLELAIMDYLDHHNAHPKPFIWTAKASDILEKVARAKQVLD